VLFVDECVFTPRSLLRKIWSTNSEETILYKKKTSFKAVAVLGAISVEGELVAYVLREGSIQLDDLKKMANKIKSKYKRRRVVMFLDNLPLHHTKAFKEHTSAYKQQLVFNAGYSSELNPIERLWALAKRSFGR